MLLGSVYSADIMIQKFKQTIAGLVSKRPVLFSALVFGLVALFVVPLSLPYWLKDPDAFSGNILVEAYGLMFDLFVIGVFVLWVNKLGEKNRKIQSYTNEIDDFREWKSSEAMHRIVGNIRRLNKEAVTVINLMQTYLLQANLRDVKLHNSDLTSAFLKDSKLNRADLSKANLVGTYLEGAILNLANLSEASLLGANMENCDLAGANLQGADLRDTKLANASFMRANLKGAIFSDLQVEALVVHYAPDASQEEIQHHAIMNALQLFRDAKTLRDAVLDQYLEETLQKSLPQLFE